MHDGGGRRVARPGVGDAGHSKGVRWQQDFSLPKENNGWPAARIRQARREVPRQEVPREASAPKKKASPKPAAAAFAGFDP